MQQVLKFNKLQTQHICLKFDLNNELQVQYALIHPSQRHIIEMTLNLFIKKK